MTPEQIATVREYHDLQPMADYLRCIDAYPHWNRDGALLTIGSDARDAHGYEPNTYEAANARTILEDLQTLDPGGTYVARNKPRTVQVDLAKAPDTVLQYLDDTAHALTNHPVLDDQMQLEIEDERNQRDWNDDLCRDVMHEIAQTLERYMCNPNSPTAEDDAEAIAQTYAPTLEDLADLGIDYYREEMQEADYGLYLDTKEAAQAIINHRTHGKTLLLNGDGTGTVRYEYAHKAPRNASRYKDGTATTHHHTPAEAVKAWYEWQQ